MDDDRAEAFDVDGPPPGEVLGLFREEIVRTDFLLYKFLSVIRRIKFL